MEIKTTVNIISQLLEWLLSKRQEIRSVDEDVEKMGEYCALLVGNWCNHFENSIGHSKT